MGDPFSIATGVAGLVSLGITVCDGLHTYFSATKDRKEDLAIVTQNLALFKFHIFAVQSSASKLGHRHSPAIDGLQLSLINCEMQLGSLQTLLDELMPTQDPSLTKELWKRQKLIARYPFDRKKLVQLEEYLSRANNTLSSFIQALNLDINIRMSDELEVFKKSLDALDINTKTTLRTIATRLDIIKPRAESSTPQLVTSRIKYATASSSDMTGLPKTAVSVAETKASLNGYERSLEDLTKVQQIPRYLQNAELEKRLCKKLGGMDCTCEASNRKTSNRPANRTYRFWGGLTVSRQGDARVNHRPGCIFFHKSNRNMSRTSLTYFGLLSRFSQSFTISLTQDYPNGPYGVSFGLQPCNIVKSSPAFRLFDIQSGRHRESSDACLVCMKKNGLDHLADNVIKKLRIIYGSGDASPFDVDQDGNNVAHICLKACLHLFKLQEQLKLSVTAIDTVCKMLSYLADLGVPITASNFNQANLFTLSMDYRDLWVLPRLHKLVMIQDSNFYDTQLAHSVCPPSVGHGEKFPKRLETLCKYPEICEDIGFSKLFLAIITKDHRRLQSILAEDEKLLNISQTDLYGRNILHASSNWPDGLKILLRRQDVHSLIEMGPENQYIRLSPLDYSLFYSKIYCNAPDQWTECDSCTCYVAVQLMLEADCKVTVGFRRADTLANCSLKARKLFFKHLKDRRQRLRHIALGIFPKNILSQYGIITSPLPDKTALPLWSLLRQTQDQRDRRFSLPDSLNPSDNIHLVPEGFFDFHYPLQVIELALDYGFTPRDENGVQTLLSGSYIIPYYSAENLEVFIRYLDWILRQNLALELSLGPYRFSILHRAAIFVGNLMYHASNLEHQDVCISELQGSRTLLPAIYDNKAQCNIPCPCSSGIRTRPLAHILPAMLWRQGSRQVTYFFSHIGKNIELVVSCIDLLKLSECSSEYSYMAKCAIRILTMMSLGVRHLPICLTQGYYDLGYSMGNEDWKEILDEDRELIDRLEALDEHFGDTFDRQNVSIAEFLGGYWLKRMDEVLGGLNKPLTVEDRWNLLEAGVLLNDDETNDSECRYGIVEWPLRSGRLLGWSW
ncbi:uncharacterized protein FMAN_08393 [Fusarium mangiferae]|uniref:Fungal N-terminal domain-containing protein n=1 Tax=Fusarium mangiferae TaxID=192010 RepID=A0A1L7TPX6_FUSMA|nr:uncharacterized protein FMAN_08393 [Fusarium mangiferae]CVK98872.1 uncharacterized protein FMAN_08393 [Fusarium mangiferae]